MASMSSLMAQDYTQLTLDIAKAQETKRALHIEIEIPSVTLKIT